MRKRMWCGVCTEKKTHAEDKDGLPYLTDHRVSVDLSHVLSTILLLYWFDVETPHGVVRVGHGHTGIVCDDVSVNCLYSFRVCTDPANLEKYMIETKLCYRILEVLKYISLCNTFRSKLILWNFQTNFPKTPVTRQQWSVRFCMHILGL